MQFVDIHGAAKVKIVPAKALRPVAHEGAGFAGGAVWGSGQGPHSHDLCARIDLDSYTKVPYEPTLARFASDLHVDGKPHPFCPRANLRRVLDAAKFQGYRFNVGIEPEFFLVTKQPDGSIKFINGDRTPHAGVSYDQEIVYDLFSNTLEAAATLGVEPAFTSRVASARGKLLGPQIGRWGQLQEWMEDIDDPKNQHRHVSHLFAVHPGRQIDIHSTPALAAMVGSLRHIAGARPQWAARP